MNKERTIVELDKRTKEWFRCHPDSVTTLMECKICGQFYKPSLGHVGCKKRKNNSAKE